MKQKQLLRTLLAAVCLLCGGMSAWAEGWSLDFESLGNTFNQDKGGVQLSATVATIGGTNMSTITYGSSEPYSEFNNNFVVQTGTSWLLRNSSRGLYMQVNGTRSIGCLNCTKDQTITIVTGGQAVSAATNVTLKSTENNTYVFTVDADGNVRFSLAAYGLLKSISVEDPSATAKNYTVKYVDTDGNEIKSQTVYSGEVGEDAVIYSTDKVKITYNNVSYCYTSDDSEGKTIASDGSTVVTVTFHEAATYNYTINAKYNDVVLKTTAGSAEEGNEVTYCYNKYYNYNGTLVEQLASNNSYWVRFTPNKDNYAKNDSYSLTEISNVIFFSEAEDIATLTPKTSQYLSDRFSGGKGAFAESSNKVVATLPAGKYKLTAKIMGTYSYPSTFTFKAGEETIWESKTNANSFYANGEITGEEFTIGAETNIILVSNDGNGSGNASKVMNLLDYFYIVKIPNSPTITTQPVEATYDVNATATALSVAATAADGGELSYQWYSNSNNSTDGAVAIEGATEISYTPSTTQAGTTTYYYCVVTEANNPDVATSDIVSVKINSAVCAAPTFTIGSYNYEEEGYAITPSCTTEGATLTYKIGNGADTECTNGVPFYAKEGKLVITASKNGWESASTPTESQYTLNVAPSSTSPETLIPFVTGSDKGDKDLLHTYKSVSIPGTYFAGIDGNNGLKLRCGKKTSSIEGVNNDFVLNVNPCYKVTKVQFSSLKSNRAAEITVDAMYVDGEAVDGFTSFNIPANSESVISKEYTDLSATSQIVWKLTPGKYTDGDKEKDVDQFRATITVTYEANTIPASISKYGYATFSSKYAVDFTDVDNAEAYIVTGKDDDNVVLQKIDGKVAAGTGLVLKSKNGAAANVTIPTTTDEGIYYNTTSDIKNYLFAVNDDYNLGESNNGTNYVLSVQDNDVVVFKPIRSVSAPVVAGHAALWIPASQGSNNAKALTMAFSNETTAINAINTVEPKADGVFYNLQGQRVSEPKQGIYVVNGKKVLVK